MTGYLLVSVIFENVNQLLVIIALPSLDSNNNNNKRAERIIPEGNVADVTEV